MTTNGEQLRVKVTNVHPQLPLRRFRRYLKLEHEITYPFCHFGSRWMWLERRLWPIENIIRRRRCRKRGHKFPAGPPLTWKTYCLRCGIPPAG